MTAEPTRSFTAGEMRVDIYPSIEDMGAAAAENAARHITGAIDANGHARVIFATGNSQFAFVDALRAYTGIAWDKVTAFHMDEYAGMDANHPASFRKWIRERIEEVFQPHAVHYIDGDAEDVEAECRRYEGLLREAPIDLICMGIGENGHIAFNDPPVADFNDEAWVKVVELDRDCRMQQVGEGHFPSFEAVPTHALTLTVPALVAPRAVQVVAPEERKAVAIRRTINDPINEACPATILRRQAHARLLLDPASASLLDT
jgi:glucosamine-6-phosphate deaminase